MEPSMCATSIFECFLCRDTNRKRSIEEGVWSHWMQCQRPWRRWSNIHRFPATVLGLTHLPPLQHRQCLNDCPISGACFGPLPHHCEVHPDPQQVVRFQWWFGINKLFLRPSAWPTILYPTHLHWVWWRTKRPRDSKPLMPFLSRKRLLEAEGLSFVPSKYLTHSSAPEP